MASFQAKIGWESPRKREKKIYLMSSYKTRNRKLKKKIAKKSKKLEKQHYGIILSQNKLGNAEKERR